MGSPSYLTLWKMSPLQNGILCEVTLFSTNSPPILLKHSDVLKIHKALLTFLWQGKRPRIALQKLCLPTSEGGAGLPNLRFYNLACLLRQGLNWLPRKSRYINYILESALVSPLILQAIIHSKKTLPAHLKSNLLIRDIVIARREVSRHLPIQGNPMFLPSTEHKTFAQWFAKGLRLVTDVLDITHGSLKPFSEICTHFLHRRPFIITS